jgi:hypothetical protein
MPSSGMLHHVVFIRTDVSEERISYIIMVTGIGELGTSAVTSNRSTLRINTSHLLLVTANVVPSSSIVVTLVMETIPSYEISVRTRTTRRHI